MERDANLDMKKETDGLDSRIAEIAIQAIRSRNFPGIVVSYLHRETGPHFVVSGSYTYEADVPNVDMDTIYDIASLTKIFTTTATLILASKGEIRLDDDVGGIFGAKAFTGVSVRHLLSHTSGLKLSLSGLKELDRDEIERIILTTPPTTVPGESVYYSNQGFFVLGKVIEKVSGQGLDKFLTENVLGPLGLSNTFFNPQPGLRNKIAPTEIVDWRGGLVRGDVHDEITFKCGGVTGVAGLFSTAGDLVMFGSFWLKGMEGSGQELIVDKIISEAVRNNFPNARNETGAYSQTFGLGWRLNDRTYSGQITSERAIVFSGFTGPSLMIDPEKNLVVATVSNRVYPSREFGKNRASYIARITEEVCKEYERAN